MPQTVPSITTAPSPIPQESRWRRPVFLTLIGIVALPLSMIGSGPCGPTLPGLLLMFAALAAFAIGLLWCLITAISPKS